MKENLCKVKQIKKASSHRPSNKFFTQLVASFYRSSLSNQRSRDKKSVMRAIHMAVSIPQLDVYYIETIFYKGIMPSEKGFRFSSGS